MTDLQRLTEMFESLGIKKLESRPDPYVPAVGYTIGLDGDRLGLTLHCGGGYYGFYADFWFDAEGKFIEYGIWE